MIQRRQNKPGQKCYCPSQSWFPICILNFSVLKINNYVWTVLWPNQLQHEITTHTRPPHIAGAHGPQNLTGQKVRHGRQTNSEGLQSLTPGDGGAVDDVLERLEDELAVDEEAQVALDGGLPPGDGGRLGLLLPLPGLVLGVQPHGDGPHLVHERLAPALAPRRGRHLGRRRRRDHPPPLRVDHGDPRHGAHADRHGQAAVPPGGGDGDGDARGREGVVRGGGGEGCRCRCCRGRHGCGGALIAR